MNRPLPDTARGGRYASPAGPGGGRPSASSSAKSATRPLDEASADGRRDFDFLLGEWRIAHRRLTRRLEEADDWEEFESTAQVVGLLDGLGVLDRYRFEDVPRTGSFEAMTLRLFDPATRLWNTWWATSLAPGHFDAPVIGCAANGCMRLFGNDAHAGLPVVVRFEYRRSPAGGHVRWEQAFSADEGSSWEVNWTMDWSRQPPPPTRTGLGATP